MKKCIVYALFGYNKERVEGCFDFQSYLIGVSVNTRLARLVYPGWEIIIETDQSTYDAFKPYFDAMPITIEINQPEKLTKAMLWRMKPVFHREWIESMQGYGEWTYSHVLCRDLDSPVTYREAQAVQYWINRDTSIHCITDSISHNLPMLGGMIGIRPKYFSERCNVHSWDEMMKKGEYNWDAKGSDQTFLNTHIYPKFAQHGSDSVTQHYLEGMPNSFLSDYHKTIQPMEIEGVPYEYSCTNDCAVHIGQSGWNQTPTLVIFDKYKHLFEDITKAEKLYPLIFYWNNKT